VFPLVLRWGFAGFPDSSRDPIRFLPSAGYPAKHPHERAVTRDGVLLNLTATGREVEVLASQPLTWSLRLAGFLPGKMVTPPYQRLPFKGSSFPGSYSVRVQAPTGPIGSGPYSAVPCSVDAIGAVPLAAQALRVSPLQTRTLFESAPLAQGQRRFSLSTRLTSSGT
jgi:hypothetical protein